MLTPTSHAGWLDSLIGYDSLAECKKEERKGCSHKSCIDSANYFCLSEFAGEHRACFVEKLGGVREIVAGKPCFDESKCGALAILEVACSMCKNFDPSEDETLCTNFGY